MKRFLSLLAALASVVATGLVVAGCGAHDVKIQGTDAAPATRLNFPNHVSTVFHKCDGLGHRVYENDHGNSPNGGGSIYVINDPRCPGGMPTGR